MSKLCQDKKNNRKPSTSKAEEDCLSIENKRLIEDQQKTIDKLMKGIVLSRGDFMSLKEDC